MALTAEQRERVLGIYRGYLAKRLETLEQLTLDQLTFNVLSLRLSAALLELADPRALLQYRLAQRLERGSVTAFGTALQVIVREVGGQQTGVEGADIMVERDGRRHYIQVKSGPEAFNKAAAQNTATQLNSARARDPGAICLAGFCYGRQEQVGAMVRAELERRGVGLLIGRGFWEFVSGDADCMDELLDLARQAAEAPIVGGTSFAGIVEQKLDSLTAEFVVRYGAELSDDAWQAFLADNS